MPCRDEYAESRTAEENIAKLHSVTEMLCSFCQAYEAHPFPNTKMPTKVRKWWAQHKAEDEARQEREKTARKREAEQLQRDRERINNRLAELRKWE